jgi:hypothetical protein
MFRIFDNMLVFLFLMFIVNYGFYRIGLIWDYPYLLNFLAMIANVFFGIKLTIFGYKNMNAKNKLKQR